MFFLPPMSTTAPTSEQIRARLVEALRLDLVGPTNDHAFANELQPEAPRRWYLTGYLVSAAEPGKPFITPLPESDGLQLVTTVRSLPESSLSGTRLPAGTRSVAVFLVNERSPDLERPYTRFAFQPRLRLETPAGKAFVARPDLRGGDGAPGGDETDERVADVQYRDVVDYAVGHGVSARWDRDSDDRCHTVETIWIPHAEVERGAPL